jgi:hypothetical protein
MLFLRSKQLTVFFLKQAGMLCDLQRKHLVAGGTLNSVKEQLAKKA